MTFTGPSNNITLSGSGVLTDASGKATVAASAGAVAGTYQVVATVTGLSPDTFTLTINPGPASQVVVVSGSPQQTLPNAAFASPLTVQVLDAYGNPVPGVVVTFTSSSNNVTLSGSAFLTNASGEATMAA